LSRRLWTGAAVLGLAALALGLTTSQVQVSARGSATASPVSSTARVDTTVSDDPSCPTIAGPSALGPTTCQVQITAEGTPYDDTAPSTGTLIVTAPPGSGVSNREFLWSSTSPVESDDAACATFEGGLGQPGIALRIGQGSDPSRMLGVTVLENFAFGARNVFDFDTWDTSMPLAFTLFGQTTIGALPSHPATFPLHMCARIIGTTVQFVVWETGMTRPPWGDPTWGGQAELPADAPASGQTGFFAGHVPAGASLTLGDLSVDGTVDNLVP
jgi:hypothetical protein